MYDAHNRTIVFVPFIYRPLLQLETWHSISLPDEVGEIAMAIQALVQEYPTQ